MSRSTPTNPSSRQSGCCETPHKHVLQDAPRARPEFTRRELLRALAATPLAGCAGDMMDSAATTVSSQPAAAAQGPAWTSAVPTVAFSEGAALSYDLKPHTLGFDPARHEMALAADSAPLAAGMTLDPTGLLKYDGTRPVASVTGIVIDIRDLARTASTVSTQAGLQPFAARVATAGVVRHFAFDSPSHLGAGPNGFGYGYNYGWYPDNGNDDHPVIDTTVFPGTSGSSLKLTMDERRGGGMWVCNFSDDLKTRFNAGDEFFVQWKQRFNKAMIGPNADLYGSWKQCLISSGDVDYTVAGVANSCRCIEVCLTSYEFAKGLGDAHDDRFPVAYHRCPDCGGTVNLTEPHPQQFLLLQNKRAAPYCGYNNVMGSGAGIAAPGGNCFVYVADEWQTFQIGITCGARVGEALPGSRIRVWAQREGRASELLMDHALTLTFPSKDPGYGKFWFTARNPYKRNTTMVTWLAELIISRQRIPDAL
jgi:hypothetical protein